MDKIIYEALKKRLDISYDDFSKQIKEWELIPIKENDEILGVVMFRDGEAHVIAYPRKNIGIMRIRKTLLDLHVTKTKVSNEYSGGHALAKRMGFVAVSVDKGITNYEIYKITNKKF